MTSKPQACAQCEGRAWRPVLYGYPSQQTVDRVRRGEAALGGCLVGDAPAAWECRDCGHRPGQPVRWSGSDGPGGGEFGHLRRAVTAADVPAADAPPWELQEFALSFDGYAAFGADGSRRLASEVLSRFRRTGQLPANLARLRNALFFAQRAARHRDELLGGEYVSELLRAIRAALGGGGAAGSGSGSGHAEVPAENQETT